MAGVPDQPSDRVALHARHHAVAAGGAVVNVRLTGALSPVLRAPEQETRPPATTVDLSSGRGLSDGPPLAHTLNDRLYS